MNQFMELNNLEWERQEKEKLELQRVLLEQMDEKKRRLDIEKQKKLMEEQYYELKL